MKIVNYYTTDRKAIFKRLIYLQANYFGITLPPIDSNVISLHDTNISGIRKVVLEYENRKDIFTLTRRNYYGNVKEN